MSTPKPAKLTAPQVEALTHVRDHNARGRSAPDTIDRRSITIALRSLWDKGLVRPVGSSRYPNYDITSKGSEVAAQACPPPPSREECAASIEALLDTAQKRVDDGQSKYDAITTAAKAVLDTPPEKVTSAMGTTLTEWVWTVKRLQERMAERDAIAAKLAALDPQAVPGE